MIKSPEGHFSGSVISIPPSLFPGIISALHIQLDHPSYAQLTGLIARYFYTPGWRHVIEEVTNSCHQCAAMKKLPKVLLEDSTTPPDNLAANFAADFIERYGQKILVVRENLSQYTRAQIIPNQTSETLREALLAMIIDLIPETGAEIRLDGATSFQSLEREAQTENTTLHKLKIKLTIGRLLNPNKNPTAEIANQELQKEILRLTNKAGPITPMELMLVLRNVNSRIRFNGYTPKEILFRRNFLTNEPITIQDKDNRQKQLENRQESSKSSRKHKMKTRSQTPQQEFTVGNLVFLRNGRSKNTPRDLFIIEQFDDPFYLIRKLNNSLRQRIYRALPDELILAPSSLNQDSDIPTLLTKAGRPLREVPKKAHGITHLQLKRSNSHKKQQVKFGWLEEDQDSDMDIFQHFPPMTTPDFNCNSPIASSTASTSCPETPSSDLDSDQELAWDFSPEQTQLSLDTCQLSYHIEENSSHHPRRYATSENNLTRSNAFRSPPDESIKGPIPQKSSSEGQTRALGARSRIPKPVSPSQIDLNQVNDISALPFLTLQSQSQITAPHQTPEEDVRPRRQVEQPRNYRVFHNSGMKHSVTKKRS